MSYNSGRAAQRHAEDPAEQLRDRSLDALVSVERKLASLAAAEASDDLPQQLAEIRALTGSAIHDLKHLADALGDKLDAGLVRGDLLARLGSLCAAFGEQSRTPCRLDVYAQHVQLGFGAADAVYRAVRELLRLHRRARAAELEISSEQRADGAVALSVRDTRLETAAASNAPSAFERNNVGLWSIDQRLREVGAYLEIGRGGGSHASIVIPPEVAAAR